MAGGGWHVSSMRPGIVNGTHIMVTSGLTSAQALLMPVATMRECAQLLAAASE